VTIINGLIFSQPISGRYTILFCSSRILYEWSTIRDSLSCFIETRSVKC